MARLDGRVCVVTGGASGIGLATTERFAAEGARVVLIDLPPEVGANNGFSVAKRLGSAVVFVPADVTNPEQLAAGIDTAVRDFGRLDVLFNNAGVAIAEGSVIDCPESLFDRVIDVDLRAVWRGIKLAAPHMVAGGGGSIISTSSGTGLMGVPGMAGYSAAKGGVIALTRAVAMELASKFVRVNCICPGVIVTPLLRASLEAGQADAVSSMAHPMPRAGQAADVADVALWLASDESSFVTGQALAVDGGLTVELDARMRDAW